MSKTFLVANQRHPRMGLNNKLCINPKYWCSLHQVWLSEEDVRRKGCRNKPSFDMMNTQVCSNLQEKDYDEWRRTLFRQANESKRESKSVDSSASVEVVQHKVLYKPQKKRSFDEWCQDVSKSVGG